MTLLVIIWNNVLWLYWQMYGIRSLDSVAKFLEYHSLTYESIIWNINTKLYCRLYGIKSLNSIDKNIWNNIPWPKGLISGIKSLTHLARCVELIYLILLLNVWNTILWLTGWISGLISLEQSPLTLWSNICNIILYGIPS